MKKVFCSKCLFFGEIDYDSPDHNRAIVYGDYYNHTCLFGAKQLITTGKDTPIEPGRERIEHKGILCEERNIYNTCPHFKKNNWWNAIKYLFTN